MKTEYPVKVSVGSIDATVERHPELMARAQERVVVLNAPTVAPPDLNAKLGARPEAPRGPRGPKV